MRNNLLHFSRSLRSCLQIPTFQHRANWHSTRLISTRRLVRTSNMATTTAATDTLAEKLKALNVSYPLPAYPNCHPEVNPVDIYRAHLTTILADITGVDAKIVYPALQWTQTLDMGDLVLPVPALRVKGKKPDLLAAEWAAKVKLHISCAFTHCTLLISTTVSRISPRQKPNS